jgi:hypothetical protein
MKLGSPEYLSYQTDLVNDLLDRLGAIRTDVSKLADVECRDKLIRSLHSMAESLPDILKKLAIQREHPNRD